MRQLASLAIDDLASIDLADPSTHAETDLTEMWRLLRRSRPVYWHPARHSAPGFWVLSRHADIVSVYRDNVNFTSEKGNVLTTLLQGGDTAAGKMLAVTDGQRHREVRNALLKAFSPRALSRVAERVRATTEGRIADAVAVGRIDFAAEVADHVPMGTICDLLGVPEADRAHLLQLNKSALSSDDPDETYSDSWAARNEILMYFSELAADRRRKPEDDVVSALATALINGEPLTPHEIIFNCYSLILGGDETSRMAMSGAVHALARHPDQWRALKSGEAGLDTAVEEVLRWTTPALHFGRVATRDVVVRDQPIKAGDIVTLWNCSANRDEEMFEAPETFDLQRTPNKHVAFGFGPHFCLGAHLARVEINALLHSLCSRVDSIELAGPVGRIRSNLLGGINRLPVTLMPA
jgi:cytochrome P450